MATASVERTQPPLPAADVAPSVARREWWQRLAERRSRWLTAHPRLARAWAVTRTVLLIGSLVWLVGLWLFLPELRLGMRAYLGCVWVVVAWFALARTKTLTWSGFLRFFTVCVSWSVGIGVLSTAIAARVAQIDLIAVSETGTQVAVAGIVEEAGKLVPVVLLALLAPRRAARFATIDWLLLGLASGTAFLAVEEAVRRTALATGNIGFGSIIGLPADGVLPPGYIRFGLFPVPTPMSADDGWSLAPTTVAEFGGHAIMTALVTGLAGLAIAAWQARRRLTGLLLGLLPVAALWSAIADHAMYNAGLDLFSALPGDGDTPAWLDPDHTTIPWWLRVPWSLLGHGHGRISVFLVLVLLCLLVDAARLTTRAAANLTGRPTPGWVARTGTRLPAGFRAVVGAVAGLVWIVARDLVQAVAGFARRRSDSPQSEPEPRRAAAARGAALVSGQRALRELAYEDASVRVRPWARRLAAVAVLAGLGWLVFAAAPATAREIGNTTNTMLDLPGFGPGDMPSGLPTELPTGLPSDFPTVPPLDLPTNLPSDFPTSLPSDFPTALPSDFPSLDPDDFPSLDPDFEFPSAGPGTEPSADPWLAGVLDAIADWWHDQPLLTQLAIGAGIAALIVLSGGSLGLAMGISGVLTWGLDHSAGIATFTRNPRQATRDYFATATPAQLAADTVGVALTFAPGNFAGAATGRILRTTADDLIADPAAWLATRRHLFTREGLADETGAIDMAHFLRRDPVPLGDGTTRAALSPTDEAMAAARYDSYASTSVKGSGAAKDYQIKVYGENERVVPIGTNTEGKVVRSEPDGFTAQYGAVGDSKHVGNESSSFYIPDSLPKEGLREAAITKMDKTLTKLQQAADKVMDGDGVVELTTNSTKAAEFIESRMKTLGIRGYVRIVPE